ncbi:nucleoporin Nup85-like protein [Coemansia spiralis]|nr:nucleoporin Nup85-like protein [Coemansia spiralis]
MREKEAATHLSPGLFPAGTQNEWTAQNRTLTFTAHPLNNGCALAVAGKEPRERISKEKRVFEQDEKVYICRMESVPDERLPFIYDSHAVFMSLQNIMKAAALDFEDTGTERFSVSINNILQMSTLYREAMLRQVRVLQEAERQTEFISMEIDVFQSMHAVWHLLEIIYLTTNTHGLNSSIVPHFMGWLNFNFPAPLAEEGQKIVDSSSTADALAANADLWPYLKKLALRGHVSILANMLERLAPSKLLSAAAARWARDIARVSRDMPLGSDEETAGSFNARWRQWNAELQNVATAIRNLISEDEGSTSNDAALESLYNIVDVMRGDVDAISIQGQIWQDIMGAVLLYNEPTAQVDRLPALVGVVVEQFQTSEFSVLDNALVALLNHDLPEFLVYCNQIESWLSAHLADIMDHISILGICRRVFAVDPREYYLLALGETYLSHENLWRVGLDYLGMTNTSAGVLVMEECVMRVPIESDRKAEQVLRMCDKYRLKRAKDRIHRQLGRQKWQRGRLGAAIRHFAYVNDQGSIGQICDQLWNEYLESGKLKYGPVIDGVVASGLRHERLQFLTRYRDFHVCYNAGDFVESGKILLSILLSEIAPPYAIPDLLVDTIPLLEGDTLVFSSEDTFELLRCAESLLRNPVLLSSADTASENIDKSELSIFNVACARNLARSFVAM